MLQKFSTRSRESKVKVKKKRTCKVSVEFELGGRYKELKKLRCSHKESNVRRIPVSPIDQISVIG